MSEERSKKLKWQISILITSLLLGVIIAVQFRTQSNMNFPFSRQRQEVGQIVQQLEQERNKLQAEVEESRKRLDGFEKKASLVSTAIKSMKKDMETAKMSAGLLPVEGQGLTITLVDSNKRPRQSEDPWFFIVHDVDLQLIVNELWASGAEAISINEQRLITSSSIRCAGPTILVNSVRLAPPYLVKVIGPAPTMEAALKMPGGLMDTLAPSILNGVQIKIKRAEKISLPAYSGSMIFKYANSAREDEK
ncbi:MAG: DUF881 domain-containing protein [Firmicutes bacterium]|nr:DUF881 domain-containing protein [Bacillota bacterium]